MQQSYRIKIIVPKGGKLLIKNLPFQAGETVEVTFRRKKSPARLAKYPLRGRPVIYREPFKSVAINDWEALQ